MNFFLPFIFHSLPLSHISSSQNDLIRSHLYPRFTLVRFENHIFLFTKIERITNFYRLNVNSCYSSRYKTDTKFKTVCSFVILKYMDSVKNLMEWRKRFTLKAQRKRKVLKVSLLIPQKSVTFRSNAHNQLACMLVFSCMALLYLTLFAIFTVLLLGSGWIAALIYVFFIESASSY